MWLLLIISMCVKIELVWLWIYGVGVFVMNVMV